MSSLAETIASSQRSHIMSQINKHKQILLFMFFFENHGAILDSSSKHEALNPTTTTATGIM